MLKNKTSVSLNLRSFMAKRASHLKNSHNTARTLSALSSFIGAMSVFCVADYYSGENKIKHIGQRFSVSIR